MRTNNSYYWILILDSGHWQPGLWDGKRWRIIGNDNRYSDEDLGQIGLQIPSNSFIHQLRHTLKEAERIIYKENSVYPLQWRAVYEAIKKLDQ